MRATSNPPSLAGISDAVWDELKTGHAIADSFGLAMATILSRVNGMQTNYARRTPYTYGPTNLGAGATYVPVAGTVVTVAMLDAVAVDDFKIVHGTVDVMKSGDGNEEGMVKGYTGMLYCDGTNVGIKNDDVAGRDLSIEGFTI